MCVCVRACVWLLRIYLDDVYTCIWRMYVYMTYMLYHRSYEYTYIYYTAVAKPFNQTEINQPGQRPRGVGQK